MNRKHRRRFADIETISKRYDMANIDSIYRLDDMSLHHYALVIILRTQGFALRALLALRCRQNSSAWTNNNSCVQSNCSHHNKLWRKTKTSNKPRTCTTQHDKYVDQVIERCGKNNRRRANDTKILKVPLRKIFDDELRETDEHGITEKFSAKLRAFDRNQIVR